MLDLEACDIAGEMLRHVGFERRHTSMKSEATYYGWPGHHQVIRVARHRAGSTELHGVPVMASVTFNARNFKTNAAGNTVISRAYVVREVTTAIGKYLLTVTGAIRARARYRNYHSGGRRELDSVQWLEEDEPSV